MGTKKQDFKSLSEELSAAKENFDYQAFAKIVLTALGKSEEEIAAAFSQITDLGKANEAIQIKLDDQTTLLIAANQEIIVLKAAADQFEGKLAELVTAEGEILKLKALNNELSNELDHAVAEIAALSKQLHIREAGAGKPGLLVDVDGEYHRLHGNSFSFRNVEGKLTAAEVAKRPELLKQMKDSQSGALIPEEVAN